MGNWNKTLKGKEYMRKYHEDKRKSLQEIVFDKYGKVCKCCGETLDSMLTIDHVNNDGFKDRGLGYNIYKKIINEGFPETYQVLCMNCNWSKRILNGICQHKK